MLREVDNEFVHYGDAPPQFGGILMCGRLLKNYGVPREEMRDLGAYGFVYIDSGNGFFRDGKGCEQDVSSGTLLLLFPGERHAYGNPRDGWRETFVVIDSPFLKTWEATGLIRRSKPVWHLTPVDYWQARFRRAVDLAARHTIGGDLWPLFRFQEWLAEARACASPRRSGKADADPWARNARHVMESQPPGPVDWASVARACKTSPDGFRKRFRRATGISPARFRTRRLMDEACRLLGTEDLTVQEIADQLGFCDPFHFSKRFKEFVGLPPKEFRKRYFPGRSPR
ncbi:MAG: helix-turn-helix transcriptional regulator [Opitutales bacterium]|nr:helix-turn-helix transcriptional regulator [Opitutales bacterium]